MGTWEEEEQAWRQQQPARRYYRLTAEGEALAAGALRRFPALCRIFDAPPEPA